MRQYETLQDVIQDIEFHKRFGYPVPEELLSEKARLEERERIDENEYIFSTMKAHNKFMSEKKEEVIRDMAEQLLIDGPHATEPCLLLGKVQCGKTDTFESIMGLTMDHGIDVCVVLTKPTNTLADQTIKRLNSDFKYFADNGRIDQKVVVYIFDILDLIKRGLPGGLVDNPRNKFIIVCKKESKNLQHLIALFNTKTPELKRRRTLIVDDEADFASRAYYKRKNELTLLKIAELIDEFIKVPSYYRYLQVTATPYSIYLQPDGTVQLRDGKEASPWLPRYTGIVPIHDKYVGGDEYYVLSKNEDSMYSHLYKEVTEKCIEAFSERNDQYLHSRAHSENIKDVARAIIGYFMAAAIRSIQEAEHGRSYKSSCLIHLEIAQDIHEWQEELIKGIIEDVKNSYTRLQNADYYLLSLQEEAYYDFKQSNEKAVASGLIQERFPTFAEVEAALRKILKYGDYTVNVVNSAEPGKVKTLLNERGQLELTSTINFFIGGSILDRGITIDNMLCFFYGRDPKKFQMDTVIQHARMYGARSKEDMAVTRFYTTAKIYSVLETMNAFDDFLRDYLIKHKDNIRTNEFTSIVIGYDKRIKPSAQNKYTPANTMVLKPQQRILPIGFQTGSYSEIFSTVAKIDKLITKYPGFKVDDYFLMDVETAYQIIDLIQETFRYSEELANMDHVWDPNEMRTVIDSLTYDGDGQIWCLQRTDRNASRLRANGKFIDAPDDGRTDRPQEIAKDRPALLLFKENGSEDQGWNNAPFYWPLLFTPESARAGIFTINGDFKKTKPKKPIYLQKVKELPPEEVLNVTMQLGAFMDIILGIQDVEHRLIKPTTQSLYLARDERGELILEDFVLPGKEYTVSDVVDGKFPFKIKGHKYIHFRCSRDDSGSKLLVSLKPRHPYDLVPEEYTESDIVYNAAGKGREEIYDGRANWWIYYNIDKVLEYKMTAKDQKTFEDYKQQLIEDGIEVR